MSSKKKKKKKELSKNDKLQSMEDQAPAPSIARLLGVEDANEAAKINSLTNRLASIETYKDIGHTTYIYNELFKSVDPYLKSGAYEQISKDYGWSLIGLSDVFGYRPFSSQFSQLFGGGPWGCFTYIAENHSAVLDCRNILYREILADGYRLIGGTKQERQFAKEVCTQLRMKYLRCQIADHLKTFGNVFFYPVRNGLKGIKELKIILPQFIRPIPTVDGQYIKEWMVQRGAFYYCYPRDGLIHEKFRPCLKNYDIGNPPLGASLVNIEADLCAQSFNNTLFQKGGLMGIAVLLEGNQGGQSRGKGPSAYAQYLQAAMQSNHSGSRAGFETVVFENAKDVKVLNKLSELDGAFGRSSDSVKKEVAHVYGIPHEMVGVVTNSNQQYHPSSMMDYSAKQLDKTLAEVLDITDNFINKKLFPLFGIKNVRIQASPRYNSVTRTAAESLKDLSAIQGFLSINEGRTEFLGRPPIVGGDVAITPWVMTSTKGSGENAGTTQVPVTPPPMPPMIMDSTESDLPDEGEGGM